MSEFIDAEPQAGVSRGEAPAAGERLPRCSEVVRAGVGLAEPWLAAASNTFWDHPQLVEMFPEFLFRLYHIAASSVALMAEAGRVAATLADRDEVAARLAEYYPRHVEEERDHPNWLLDDLPAVGLDPEQVRSSTPPPIVASLVGSQYYWIHRGHPVAALGYFAVLEGKPPEAEHLGKVRARTGLPAEAFRMMLAHEALDEEHREEIYALLDELPLSVRQRELVGVSALQTVELATLFYQDLLATRNDGTG